MFVLARGLPQHHPLPLPLLHPRARAQLLIMSHIKLASRRTVRFDSLLFRITRSEFINMDFQMQVTSGIMLSTATTARLSRRNTA